MKRNGPNPWLVVVCALIMTSAMVAQVPAPGGTPSMNGQVAARADAIVDAPTQWTDLGHALAGYSGEPILAGKGLLEPGTSTELALFNARPVTPALLFVSVTATPTAFKGGVLVPLPALLEIPVVTTRQGVIDLSFDWPAGIPGGTDIFMQYVIVDPAAIAGFALSNALLAHPLRY